MKKNKRLIGLLNAGAQIKEYKFNTKKFHKRTTEDAVFHIYADFTEYDEKLRKLVDRFKELELPLANSSISSHLLNIDLGETEIRKWPDSKALPNCGGKIVGNIGGLNPRTSQELHEIIFASVSWNYIKECYPRNLQGDLIPILRYKLKVLEHKIDESSVKYKKQTVIPGLLRLGKLSFDVSGKLQYYYEKDNRISC